MCKSTGLRKEVDLQSRYDLKGVLVVFQKKQEGCSLEVQAPKTIR